MTRYVVIRDSASREERVVQESAIPTEAALHEVLMRHPSLIPAADLGFGRVVTVGFEASLASGSADLVLLDEEGRLCIVEVKKEGNPDTRRVIAQLLDYAAALWGKGLDDFERDVWQRMPHGPGARSLRRFIVDELVSDADDPESAADATLEGLADTLNAGDFSLVLAAPTIPSGIQRVIEYLNVRGHAVFGLEVSYFEGGVEAFVPRVVVRPSLSARIAGQGARSSVPLLDAERLLAALPEPVRERTQLFLDEVEEAGGELDWKEHRVRVRVRGASGPKVVVTIEPSVIWFTHGQIKGLNPRPGARVAAELRNQDGVAVGDHYASLKIRSAATAEVEAALDRAREYVAELVESVIAGGEVSEGRTAAAYKAHAGRTAEERSAAARKAWETRRGT